MSIERGKYNRVGADESTLGTIASREVLRSDDGDRLAGLRLHQQNLAVIICKDKKVSRINLVLDHKATNKTLKLWAFITQVIERTYLADNHSKILLVKSESGKTVSVITSQNLTRGNRAESAFISTDPIIFASLYAQIEDLITNHSVPLNELFAQRITAD